MDKKLSARLAEHGLSDTMIRAVVEGGAAIHPVLAERVRIAAPVADAPPAVTALWEFGDVVTGLREDGVFISYERGLPGSPRAEFLRFRDVLERLLVSLWEDGTSDEQLREVGSLLGYPGVDPLLHRLATFQWPGDAC